MKRIILSVLALGLSMGLMAQKVYNGAEPMKGQLKNSPKTSGLIYPESFQDCGSDICCSCNCTWCGCICSVEVIVC